MTQPNDNEIQERLRLFQADIAIRDISYLVRRYTTFGQPYAISSDQYFNVKSMIADHFNIHPSEIVMVGSAKLGFSIKHKKRYQPFGDQSDIDIAIVSPSLFERVWHGVLDYSETGEYWYYQTKREFQEYLFRGWIRPDKLPPSRTFQFRDDWWEFFRALTHQLSTYKINGGLYKSWHHFEIYQSRAVDECKQDWSL